jgi:hypothetical protein
MDRITEAREAPIRIAVAPSARNGLGKPSPLMVELDLALRGWLDLP